LREFSIVDDSGRALHLPNRQLSNDLATEALLRIACTKNREYAPEVEGTIRDIVHLSPRESLAILEGWVSDESNASMADYKRDLLNDFAFNTLAAEFARQFLMLVPVDPDRVEQRQVLKYGFVTGLDWGSGLRLRPLQRLGLRATGQELLLGNAGLAASYHVEVSAPEAVDIAGASLVRQGGGREGDSVLCESRDRNGAVHFATHSARPFVNQFLFLFLHAQRRGMVRTAWLASIFTTAMLFVLLFLHNRIGVDKGGLDPQAAGSLLIAVPAIVAAFILRPSEHTMASRLLSGMRALVALSGLLALVAAGIIAIPIHGAALTRSLEILAYGSLVPTVTQTLLLNVYNFPDLVRKMPG
jgi:hypothetical protein